MATLVALHQLVTQGIGAMELTLLFGLWALTLLGLVAGFRRLFAQRSFRAPLLAQRVLVVLGSMAAQGSLVHWVAWYRRHQGSAERTGAIPTAWARPASGPAWHVLWQSHVGWMFAREIPNPGQVAFDLLRQPVLMQVANRYRLWVALGLLLPAAAGGLWTGTLQGLLSGALWGGPVRLFLAGHALWTVQAVIDLVAHRPGRAGSSEQGDGAPGHPTGLATGEPREGTATRRSTAEVEAGLIVRISALLDLPRTAIDPAESLGPLGLDSITVVALVADLEDWLGIEVDPTLPLRSTSIRELSAQVAGMTG